MRRLWVLAWIATSGCVEPSSLQCSDGRTCPTDTTCDLTHNLCATDAQIAGCVNKSDGDACSFSNQVGTCDVGVCIGSSCGNGSVDPGEACDDHNQTGGDGCSADCSKTELCGDAVVDVGEACDDGDSNPANGCDACVATGWTATAVIGGTADPLGVAIRGVHGITVGTDGAVYFVENHRVRRLDPTGVITTVAGIGIAGFSGDGGLATSAKLNFPNNVAVDGLGNVYFADFFNHRIRRVDPSGIITTVAGSGAAGFSGDNGPAIAASLNKPRGISVDGSGNLYIADSFNLRIRYVDVTTGIITTIAGGGVTSGDGPATTIALGHVNNIVFDSTPGTFYFTDEDSDRICKVANGMLTTVAGTLDTGGFGGDGGPATSALLNDPEGLARDAAGNLYIADNLNRRIRRVAPNGIITTVAGTGVYGSAGDGGPATAATLASPWGLAATPAGMVYIGDSEKFRLRMIDAGGTISTVVGTGTQTSVTPATSATIRPTDILVDASSSWMTATTAS